MPSKKVTIMLSDEAYEILRTVPPKSRGIFVSMCVTEFVRLHGGNMEEAFKKSMIALVTNEIAKKHATGEQPKNEPEDDLGLDPRAIAGEQSDGKKDKQEEDFEPEIKFDL